MLPFSAIDYFHPFLPIHRYVIKDKNFSDAFVWVLIWICFVFFRSVPGSPSTPHLCPICIVESNPVPAITRLCHTLPVKLNISILGMLLEKSNQSFSCCIISHNTQQTYAAPLFIWLSMYFLHTWPQTEFSTRERSRKPVLQLGQPVCCVWVSSFHWPFLVTTGLGDGTWFAGWELCALIWSG